MKRLSLYFILIMLVVLLIPSPVLAQSGSSYTITVTGVGTASAQPDLITFEVGAEAVNSDSVAAYDGVIAQLESVRAGLLEAKVSTSDIELLTVTVIPQDRTDNGAAPTGEFLFRARGAWHVVVRDSQNLQAVLDAAVHAGADSIQNFTFGFNDTTLVEQRARTAAITNAYKRADQLAKAMSVAVGDPIIILENNVQINFVDDGTTPTGTAGTTGTAIGISQYPIKAGQATIRVEVQVTFALRASR